MMVDQKSMSSSAALVSTTTNSSTSTTDSSIWKARADMIASVFQNGVTALDSKLPPIDAKLQTKDLSDISIGWLLSGFAYATLSLALKNDERIRVEHSHFLTVFEEVQQRDIQHWCLGGVMGNIIMNAIEAQMGQRLASSLTSFEQVLRTVLKAVFVTLYNSEERADAQSRDLKELTSRICFSTNMMGELVKAIHQEIGDLDEKRQRQAQEEVGGAITCIQKWLVKSKSLDWSHTVAGLRFAKFFLPTQSTRSRFLDVCRRWREYHAVRLHKAETKDRIYDTLVSLADWAWRSHEDLEMHDIECSVTVTNMMKKNASAASTPDAGISTTVIDEDGGKTLQISFRDQEMGDAVLNLLSSQGKHREEQSHRPIAVQQQLEQQKEAVAASVPRKEAINVAQKEAAASIAQKEAAQKEAKVVIVTDQINDERFVQMEDGRRAVFAAGTDVRSTALTVSITPQGSPMSFIDPSHIKATFGPLSAIIPRVLQYADNFVISDNVNNGVTLSEAVYQRLQHFRSEWSTFCCSMILPIGEHKAAIVEMNLRIDQISFLVDQLWMRWKDPQVPIDGAFCGLLMHIWLHMLSIKPKHGRDQTFYSLFGKLTDMLQQLTNPSFDVQPGKIRSGTPGVWDKPAPGKQAGFQDPKWIVRIMQPYYDSVHWPAALLKQICSSKAYPALVQCQAICALFKVVLYPMTHVLTEEVGTIPASTETHKSYKELIIFQNLLKWLSSVDGKENAKKDDMKKMKTIGKVVIDGDLMKTEMVKCFAPAWPDLRRLFQDKFPKDFQFDEAPLNASATKLLREITTRMEAIRQFCDIAYLATKDVSPPAVLIDVIPCVDGQAADSKQTARLVARQQDGTCVSLKCPSDMYERAIGFLVKRYVWLAFVKAHTPKLSVSDKKDISDKKETTKKAPPKLKVVKKPAAAAAASSDGRGYRRSTSERG